MQSSLLNHGRDAIFPAVIKNCASFTWVRIVSYLIFALLNVRNCAHVFSILREVRNISRRFVKSCEIRRPSQYRCKIVLVFFSTTMEGNETSVFSFPPESSGKSLILMMMQADYLHTSIILRIISLFFAWYMTLCLQALEHGDKHYPWISTYNRRVYLTLS